jgi:hypothetical protein
MLLNEFSEEYYRQLDDDQKELLRRFQQLRDAGGWPPKFRFLRSIAKTRKYTRTIYPPGWKFI